MSPKQIIIVSNKTDISQLAYRLLDGGEHKLYQAENCDLARSIIQKERIDVILLGFPSADQCLPHLDYLLESGIDPAVIALLDTDDHERYLMCHKEGALDCLTAPLTAERLIKSIERCVAIKSLEREKRDFVSMLSHDLKNPLTAAIGSIDLVREKRLGPLNPEQQDYLASAIESCNEVVSMIDNLLDIHRFEGGKLVFNKSPLNLVELTRYVLHSFRGIIKQVRINLTTRLDDNIPELLIDRGRFSRVIANLIANAVKFTPDGGDIVVSCGYGISETSKMSVVLQVKDSGSGISQLDLPLIFDRFVQASKHGGRGSGGSGLGLAFCKMTVEAHGGTIKAISQKGEGSEFIITLPIPEE